VQDPAKDTRFNGNFEITIDGASFQMLHLGTLNPALEALPACLKILAENVLRRRPDEAHAFENWITREETSEVEFQPGRVLMHDTTCVPALVDLATLRDAVAERGGDAARVNPAVQVDLVIDHSVMVDRQGSANAAAFNLARELERNRERYEFIRWAENSLANFRVVPPGVGIIHQINLEHLSQVVRVEQSGGASFLYPDTLVGTDSHTPMINALGILGWGVGGVEGLSAALGQPLTLQIPSVVGIRLVGTLGPGVTATDLALALTHRLREQGVVEKLLEFYGPGMRCLSVADRATIANMAPEYGATCSYFPIDESTIQYLAMVGRPREVLIRVEAYARAQGIWHDPDSRAVFSERMEIDLSAIEPTVAGPKRPEDSLSLSQVGASFRSILPELSGGAHEPRTVDMTDKGYSLRDGAVLIAAITSCTNTSNPALMVGAGLVARKARAAGLRVPGWVKTSLSPGSHAVTDYLRAAGLQDDLDALGFQVAGYGCMTCIGNSGLLDPAIAARTSSHAIVGAAVLSGNRNFQGRINPEINAAFLASPALVVAYALAGSVLVDLTREPLGHSASGAPVFLRDLWPSDSEIREIVDREVTPEVFRARAQALSGPSEWKQIDGGTSVTFPWRQDSTYLRQVPYFSATPRMSVGLADIHGAKALLVVGDNVTTDHISPAGTIPSDSLAGRYLKEHGVPVSEFNQYSTRRGNHEVMLRGIFSNPRLRNELVPEGTAGGVTRSGQEGELLPVYEAGLRYRQAHVPLIIVAGRNYGTGSSRDWAAKGPALLGVRAVLAESFERIHRCNLIGLGVLPLQFSAGIDRRNLALDGTERVDLLGIDHELRPRQTVTVVIHRRSGVKENFSLTLRAETEREAAHLQNGGLLAYMLREFLSPA
jgi:aconitate hydratase